MMEETMHKEGLVNYIAEKNDITKFEAGKIIQIFTEAIMDIVASEQAVSLIGFGSFDIIHSKAREGRNPATGLPMKIAASKRPTFKAGKKFKDAVK